MADYPIAQFAEVGAYALHLGSTLEQRRARTAAARAASAEARRQRRDVPTVAERIAAVEATLHTLDPVERARQQAWIDGARLRIAEIDEARAKRTEPRRFAQQHGEAS